MIVETEKECMVSVVREPLRSYISFSASAFEVLGKPLYVTAAVVSYRGKPHLLVKAHSQPTTSDSMRLSMTGKTPHLYRARLVAKLLQLAEENNRVRFQAYSLNPGELWVDLTKKVSMPKHSYTPRKSAKQQPIKVSQDTVHRATRPAVSVVITTPLGEVKFATPKQAIDYLTVLERLLP